MRCWRTAAVVALAVASLVLGSLPGTRARAQAAPREIRLTMPHVGYDIAYVATGGALYLTAQLGMTPREGDRAPLGRAGAHAYHEGADIASDVTVGLVLALGPIVGFVLDGSRSGDYVLALRVPIVLFESFLMASAITGMLKNVGVCRPYAWDPDARVCEAAPDIPNGPLDHRRSFPSGHATGTASIAGGLLGMWLLPSERDDRLAPLALGMTVLSLTTAALRVRAGAHSMTDVGVGFGIGLGVGLGTAALHLRASATRRVGVAPMGRGLMLHGIF